MRSDHLAKHIKTHQKMKIIVTKFQLTIESSKSPSDFQEVATSTHSLSSEEDDSSSDEKVNLPLKTETEDELAAVLAQVEEVQDTKC